jgi:hypothetical protein
LIRRSNPKRIHLPPKSPREKSPGRRTIHFASAGIRDRFLSPPLRFLASLREALLPPKCSPSRENPPQFSRRILASCFFAFLTAAHLIPRDYYCEDSRFTWPENLPRDIDRDALNWPRDSKIPPSRPRPHLEHFLFNLSLDMV